MAESDGEKVVTMMDVLREQEDFEEDANAVLGASDDKNCTYNKGYVKRQAIYACLTCCPDSKTDPMKRAGVCLACSLTCHENHELIELYTKRNFRCDCGNPKFNSHPCHFTPNKTDLNYENKYNQNFVGIYCTCHRPYPDPEATEEEEMIQCIICEDWLHSNHLEATVPNIDNYAEMVCKDCMDDNDFLHDYCELIINVEDKEVIITDPDLDVDITTIKMSLTNGNTTEGKIVNSTSEVTSDKTHAIVTENNESIMEISKEGTDLDKEIVGAEPTVPKESGDEIIKTDENITEETINAPEPSSLKDSESSVIEETLGANDSAPEGKATSQLNIDNRTLEQIEEDKLLQDEQEKFGDKQEELSDKPEKTSDKPEEPAIKIEEPSDKIEEPADLPEKPADKPEQPSNKSEDVNDVVTTNNEIIATDKVEADSQATGTESLDTTKTEDVEMKDESADEIKSTLPEGTITNGTSGNGIEALNKTDTVTNTSDVKRKFSTDDEPDNIIAKKQKLDEKKCERPRGVKRVYKGATFWPSNLRQKLCSCNECISMYKDLAVLYLTDPDDTVSAYEALGKDNSEGPSSQYEKGLQALSSLDRVQQINALTEYNKMRDKLLDFLKSFKDRKEVVKEEDIRAFFAGMKPKREPDGVYFCR